MPSEGLWLARVRHWCTGVACFFCCFLPQFLCTIHRKLFLVLFIVRLYSTAQWSVFHVDNASLRSLPIPGFPAPSHFSGERKTVIFRSPWRLNHSTVLSASCFYLYFCLQLILSLAFNQAVRLNALRFEAPSDGRGPRSLRLFVNQPTTPDFDACESLTSVQDIVYALRSTLVYFSRSTVLMHLCSYTSLIVISCIPGCVCFALHFV